MNKSCGNYTMQNNSIAADNLSTVFEDEYCGRQVNSSETLEQKEQTIYARWENVVGER